MLWTRFPVKAIGTRINSTTSLRYLAAIYFAALFSQCSNTTRTKDLLDANFSPNVPLTATPAGFSVLANESISLKISGGVSPYAYKIFSGVGSVSSQGVFTSPDPGLAAVQVSDSRDSKIVISGNVLAISKDPASIPGISANLQMWLKADSLGLSDGASLATWTDSSTGHAPNNLTAGAPAPIFKAAVYNGNPAVRFSGSSTATMTYGLSSSITIFLVASPSSTSNAYVLYGNQAGNTPSVLSSWGSRAYEYYVQNGVTTDRLPFSGVSTGLNVLTLSQNATSLQMFFNASPVQNSPPVIAITGQLSGFSPSGARFSGDVSELIIFNTALTTNERYAVECYLLKKYAITNAASCQ